MDLQARLERYVDEDDVPGAVLGVLVDGEVHEHAAGVLNRNTGVDVTTDSVFQIGSNTKVWTATQIMQLVDRDEVELDAPVRTYLDGFGVRDPRVSERLTVRHLLTHTSGIEGDVFDDFGTNDDAIGQYVAALTEQGSVHDLDETWSYCNSGWVIAGRIVEAVTGRTWAASLKETIAEPLDMTALCTTADEAILHRAAVGHLNAPGEDGLHVAPTWALPAGIAPAGLITTTVGDLLRFARMHLEDGRAPDGTAVLSPESTALMQTPHVECPATELATHWGLGWMIRVQDGRRVIGHGGNTLGQSTFFFAVPDRRVAVALLTNASGRSEPSEDLVREVLHDFADIELPARPQPSVDSSVEDPSRFVGTYERLGVRTTVAEAGGRLQATIEMEGPMAEALGLDGPLDVELHAVAGEDAVFLVQLPHYGEGWLPLRFYGDDSGRARFLHTGARVAKRTS